MKNLYKSTTCLLLLILLFPLMAKAQNPLVLDQYTADPTARVFNGKLYVYPSHDILCTEDKGRVGWFCMEDYHVFSSDNLTAWKDHGEILNQTEVAWADPSGYSMWAPDCVERDGKYYFYFPTKPKDEKGFKIGVAISDSPEGPFVPQQEPIAGVNGIDPNVFIDSDGQAYLYWSGGNIFVAKLKPNMTELASEPEVIANLPQEGLKEGPFVFKRNDQYYLTYPHVANKTERLEYAMGPSPMGPFTVTGVIMDESPTGCWTNHQSIVNFKDQWYLFYHHNDLSPDFDKNRSIRADSLSFNNDGTIVKVQPTLRGIGINEATEMLQIDRYSSKSDSATVQFNNPEAPFQGWHAVLNAGDFIKYNQVNFEDKLSQLLLNVKTKEGAEIEISFANSDESIAKLTLANSTDFNIQDFELDTIKSGIHDIKVQVTSGTATIDWIQFK
ncbi:MULTISPECIES: family 43 glycosylhydrolase [unclassified Leeuwenhoekiella]|uniref:family 43 glycosylhydrolase n=1 Tax=unclassified Leeuwenhoekiella TaxID=2615029 RepID=UPI0025C5CF19|nr:MULTISPECIES: family 43 glycosylhydrolase [unclassified Leeuwenhoekiella]